VDRLDGDVAGVPELRILLEHDAVVRHEALEHVGAVRHHVPGPGEGVPVLLDRSPVERRAGLMGEQREEVRRRVLERDFEGAVVDRAGAEFIWVHAAGIDRLGVADRVENARVARAGRRVHDAPEGEDEIVGSYRVAVRPAGVLAQGEGVGKAVLGNLPALRHALDHLAVGAVDHQRLVQVADQVALGHRRGAVVVERCRIRVVAAHQRLGGRARGQEQRETGEAGGERADVHGFPRKRRMRNGGTACTIGQGPRFPDAGAGAAPPARRPPEERLGHSHACR
jgi:hypothetical protein